MDTGLTTTWKELAWLARFESREQLDTDQRRWLQQELQGWAALRKKCIELEKTILAEDREELRQIKRAAKKRAREFRTLIYKSE